MLTGFPSVPVEDSCDEKERGDDNGLREAVEGRNRNPVVHIENRRSGQFFHERDDVGAYQDAVSWLRDVALSPDDSAKLIAKVIG
ncbi:Scr1 family TA system antitoxin-like transcriptional regulator [Saccharopolyspora sp. NPDC050642]|uniref:Scr1 family TA system antitoxin-like transcriptional regulator n=1 Tax=Saccharopolyspora sp. NPDC050642 TaxID=3157099 RepID=UPI0033F98282